MWRRSRSAIGIADPCKGEGMRKATEAWLESDFQAECAIQATVKATYEAERTAKQAMAEAAQAFKQSEGVVLKVQTTRNLAPPGLVVARPTQTADYFIPTRGNAVTVSSSTTPLQNLRLPRQTISRHQQSKRNARRSGNRRRRETLKLWTKPDLLTNGTIAGDSHVCEVRSRRALMVFYGITDLLGRRAKKGSGH